jgi:hypothetical protein
VDNDGGMVEGVLEETLVGVIADRCRHFAFAVREHAVGGYDHKAFDSAHWRRANLRSSPDNQAVTERR